MMTDGTEIYFKYSASKLNAIKNILSHDKLQLIKTFLRNLDKDVNRADPAVLFAKEMADHSRWANAAYLSYLSRYSNNVVQFSAPKEIDLPADESNFRWLFEKYVFKFDDAVEADREFDITSRVKKCLYPAIAENVNIDITLDSNDLQNLFASIEVNFLGANGVPVAGQTFDFEKKHHFLENDVSRYVSLVKALELEGKRNGKYFVLGREPQQSNQKGHSLWRHIRDSHFLEFIDIDEYGIVEEYIKSNDVRPYFQEE